MPKSNTEKSRARRAKDAQAGVAEVRGIRAKVELHPAIKKAAARVKAKTKQAA